MHEPFLPLPLPEPPELGVGTLVARAARRWAARLRPRRPRGQRAREPRLADASCSTQARGPQLRFPFHPPGF